MCSSDLLFGFQFAGQIHLRNQPIEGLDWAAPPDAVQNVHLVHFQAQRLVESATIIFLIAGCARHALRGGQPWVEQDAGPRLDRDETTRRGGHLRRFKGRMAVLTDGDCAGACLDFVDAVKRVPGSVHTGQTTRAHPLYVR